LYELEKEITMKKSKVLRDNESFYVDTHAGRLRSDEVGAIEELAKNIEQNIPCPPEEFLAAWKDGVSLAGEQLFTIRSESVSAARNIDELRPDLDFTNHPVRPSSIIQ